MPFKNSELNHYCLLTKVHVSKPDSVLYTMMETGQYLC
jgi:hypothetical protein